MAKPPVPKIGPIAICFLYPRFCISGTIRDPNNAVAPSEDPERVAKAVPPATVTKDNLPGIRPINRSTAENILFAKPV